MEEEVKKLFKIIMPCLISALVMALAVLSFTAKPVDA
jgi:hypothetical protein